MLSFQSWALLSFQKILHSKFTIIPLRKKKINMHMGRFLFHFLKQLNYVIILELKKPRLVAMTF
jgi:hypothetical protein